MATTISSRWVKGAVGLILFTTIRVAAGAVAAAMEPRVIADARDRRGAGRVQPNQGDIHQGGGDHRLGNAHGHGAATHAPQGAEPELVADDKGDKAQRHLGEDAVALHGCSREPKPKPKGGSGPAAPERRAPAADR